MKKFILLTIMLASTTLFAQKGNYFLVKANYGLATFKYDIEDGTNENGYAGGAEVGYRYFFTDHWGLGTGIGFSKNEAEGSLNRFFTSVGEFTDIEGDVFTSNLYLKNWIEHQKSYFLEVPILLSYQYNFPKAKKWTLYSDAGIKLKVPTSSKYEVKEGMFENQGYYDQWHTTIHDVPGRFEKTEEYLPKGDLDYKAGLSVTADVGLMYQITNRLDLLFGVMMDYGITDIKDERYQVLSQDGLNNIVYNSITESPVTKEVIPINVKAEIGLRLKLFTPKKVIEKSMAEDVVIEEIDTLAAVSPDSLNIIEPVAVEFNISPERKAEIKVATNKILDLGKIYFVFNRSYLTDYSKGKLDQIIEQLKMYPEIKVYLSGHASNEGSNEYNMRLSQRRANTVGSYLYKHCPNSILIDKEAFGESMPDQDNNTERGRQLNRRVEIKVKTSFGDVHSSNNEEKNEERF